VSLDDVRAGDVLVVGKKGAKKWGSHITLCTSLSITDGYAETVEGNAHGTLGTGGWGEGVVRRRRPFARVAKEGEAYIMHAYRWLPEDFEV
jgi:hypothetical protein